MTQRGRGMTTDRQTSAPILKLWPTHAFSTKSFTPEETSTTMFGRNLLTSKRPCGKTSRRRSIVAEVTRWTGAKSKNVPGGAPRAMDSSVTVSLLGRPSISGQYSSKLGESGADDISVTSRPSALEKILFTVLCWLLTVSPFGRVIRTGGVSSPVPRGSMKAAR